ncbi:MAG: YfhO family protein [Clostridiales bacterium]|nr:YfhO family protein [Clostridiales bacterium]
MAMSSSCVLQFFSRRHKKRRILAAAFLIPLAVILIGYAVRGLAPFGSRGLISMDGWGQYFPMLKELRRAIYSGAGFEYSFSGANGFNLWVQSAYYTNSPLWLPLFFIPEKWMPTAVNLIVALRFGLSGMFFALWLCSKKENDPTVVLFSSCYALSSWALAFINQLMWMDAFMLLPLVTMGIERLFRQKKPFLYILTLALTLWSNFYIGWMICIFCVLWFCVLSVGEKSGKKTALQRILTFFLSSLLAGGIAAAVLIPTYLGLAETIASTLTFGGELKTYHGVFEILQRLLPFQKTSLQFGTPNIYCGVICVPLALCALFDRKIPLKKRVSCLVVTVFMLVSFNLNLLDYIWHGMHYPNQLPARQSFIFSFLLVTFAYCGWNALCEKAFRPREADGNRDSEKLSKRYMVRFTAFGVAALLLAAEVVLNAFYYVSSQIWVTNLTNYTSIDTEMKILTQEYRPGYDDFFRCELMTPYNFNAGQLYGFNGISYYSSTMSADAYNFFIEAGMPVYAQNVSTRYSPNPVANALFGVKYIFETGINEKEITELSKAGLESIEKLGKVTVYENRFTLPLGFRVEGDMGEFEFDRTDPWQIRMNKLLKSTGATDKNVLVKTGKDYVLKEDVFSGAVSKLQADGLRIKSFSNTRISGSVSFSEDGLLFISIPADRGWSVYVDGNRTEPQKVAGYFLGVPVASGDHEVRLVYRTPGLTAGLIISLLSSAAVILLWSYVRKKSLAGKTHSVCRGSSR